MSHLNEIVSVEYWDILNVKLYYKRAAQEYFVCNESGSTDCTCTEIVTSVLSLLSNLQETITNMSR